MKYKLKDMASFQENTALPTSSYLMLDNAEVVSLKSANEVVIETDLPLLYKKRASGKWQTLSLGILVKEGASYMHKEILTEGRPSPKIYDSLLYAKGFQPRTSWIEKRLTCEWNKKHRQGWSTEWKPMECDAWHLRHSNIQYPALISPVMRGQRTQYDPRREGLFGRFGYGHKDTRLYTFVKDLDIPLEGVLYHPSWYDGTVPQDDSIDHLLLMYVFDVPNLQEPSYPKRIEKFLRGLQQLGKGNDQLKCVPIGKVDNEQDAERCIKVIKEMDNVTGAVIRNMQSPYIYNSISADVLEIDFSEEDT